MSPTASARDKPLGQDAKKNIAGAKSYSIAADSYRPPDTTMNYKEVQQDEVDALQAIYFDGYEEVEINHSAWNKPADHAFRIRLRSGIDEDVAIYLSVQLTATYPNTAPILSVTGMDFLRSDFRTEISKVLTNKASTLLGHEMIHEIAECIEEILDRAAQNIAVNVDGPTLEEERVLQEKTTLEAVEKEEKEAELLREEAKRDEERMMGRMLSAELSRRREKARQVKKSKRSSGLDDNTFTGHDTEQTVSFDRAIGIKDKRGNGFHFNTVGGMVKLRQGPATEVLLVHPKLPQDSEIQSPSLALKKVKLRATDNHSIYKRSIQDLEQELEKLKSLSGRNANVVDILDFKITAEIGENSWRVTVLTEFANRGSLKELLEVSGGGCPAIQNVRMRAVELLGALEFYHCNGLVHGTLHAANVLFAESTSGPPTLKIADTGFQWRLRHLRDQSNHPALLGMEAQSPGWLPPDLLVEDFLHPTRKIDIWSFGIIFLQMIFGLDVTQKYSSPVELLDTLSLSESLNDYIRKIFKSDSKRRPSAFNLLTEEFIRDSVPIMATQSSLHSRISSASLLSPQLPRTRQDSLSTPMIMSRYLNDFDEVGRLGKGGFGEVVKSRNKLDGQLYAIKKITQNSTGSLSEVLSEIMLLSRLNHPQVVRYFTAWIEEDSSWPAETDDEVFSSTEESSSQAPNVTGPSVEFGHTSGLDIISSSGYPNIEFGYDTEEDSGPESGEVSPNGVGPVGSSDADADADVGGDYFELKRTRSSSKAVRLTRKTLYIQMEYCEKHTLRDLIRRDISKNPDEIWKMLRQIVEGLQHIHGHGIIHRDLKPDNVFIDLTNTPRIGDFGLATSGQYTIADKGSSQGMHLTSDLTRSIGTALYVAPEIRSTTNESYTDKVDMYSLGIILFEMCQKLPTYMERDMTLRRLREKEHSLPSELCKGAKAPLGNIISSLIDHNPKERPSSTELLQSGKLPLQVGDETIRQALQGLSDSKSPYYQKMMTALFTQPIRQVKDYAWDMDVSTKIGANELLLQSLVKDELCTVFRHHGAVETTRPLVFPRSSYYPSNAVQFLDQSGTLVQLPYDLTLPNARAIAKRSPAALKSFTFGSIFRNLHDGAQPSSHPEVDFDIITHDTKDLALQEAEVIKVIDEVVDAFPSLASAQMCFHLNHSDLLETIMEFCRIGVPQRGQVKDVLSKLHIQDWTWQKIRNLLRAPSLGVSSTSLDEMSRFDFRDEPAKAFLKIKEIFEEGGFSTDVLGKVQGVILHMNDVFVYLKRLNVSHKVYISPLSSFNDKFYKGGLLFQCLYDNKKRDVFAAGGRYDRLIRDHRPKTQGSYDECYAVGFNLAWEKIFKSMLRYQKTTGKAFLKKSDEVAHGPWAERRCDVLIASFDSSTLRSMGLNIVRELWAAGISAEIAIDTRSPDELSTIYKDDRHNWIVMIRQETGSHGERGLKVRNMVRKDDTEVRSSELRAWLQGEIRDRSQREHTHQRAHLFRAASLPETSQPWSEHDPDVRVLFSQHKSKKNNRRSVVEAAHTRTQSLTSSFLDGPVAAVEIRDEVLDEIRGTRLSDPDGWRKLLQSVPVNDRKYLGQIHELLGSLANEMKGKTRNAFVYNFRTGACIYYDLGA